jgi:hypothetical protein
VKMWKMGNTLKFLFIAVAPVCTQAGSLNALNPPAMCLYCDLCALCGKDKKSPYQKAGTYSIMVSK